MAIIAMVSAKGSPGVTTTALACTLAWSGRTVLAECDPAGGSVLSGYLSSLEIPPIGLLPLAAAALRDQLADAFAHQLVDLDAKNSGQRLVLPGINDPVQAGTIRPTWEALTAFFADLERHEPGYDVIADCGRLATSAPPWPLLFRADLLLLVVCAATLRTIAPAAGAAEMLRRELTQYGQGPGALALALIGEGPYSRRDIEQRLQLPTLIELPDDRRTAEVLSDGGGRLRGSQRLLRAAASAEPAVRDAIARRRAHLAPTSSRGISRA
ncbi:ParA family protein [Micromonospora sp. WMMA1947]|uniref:ParA family protein n=1 Tax=Micromonospora sp. WMMA1947 TaxID=3015163 RepID=UPI00248C250C|nr:ParA family protein [Micromonospora sp. WMMA1947]WBC08899.1 ParA family protein [Micromonospora sp. WMMA1947]